MSATFSWSQAWGAANITDLGTQGNLMNFKTSDDGTPANYTSYPVTAGSNSYEVNLRASFAGTFNKIQNLQFWQSAGSLGTGCALKWCTDGTTIYNQATTAASGHALAAIPAADPGTANVGIGGDLQGSLVAVGYSDYMVSQLQTSGTAAPGDTGTITFTLQQKSGPYSSDIMSAVGYMLERPSILHYSSIALIDSEKVTSAENQQGSFNRQINNPSETTRRLSWYPSIKIKI